MAYNIKDIFYLSTDVTVVKATALGGSAQLDLSAYIDPIARGRAKGTGLAIYKVHWAVQTQDTNSKPIDDAEAGTLSYALIAGLGSGDQATGSFTATKEQFHKTNALLVSSGYYYGPKSMVTNASTPQNDFQTWVSPDTEVPYVIVRDNVCLVYMVGDNMTDETTISVRLECAQISLDQSVLNQLLRTQTV
jgi:hypothetical protein